MNDQANPDWIITAVEDLSYPIMRNDAAVALDDVDVDGLDEQQTLGALVSDLDADMFDSPEMMIEQLEEVLPEQAL